MELLDAPLLLEGGTGLGKTRAYLAAIKEYEGTVAIVLPTIQLMDQLLASSDLGAAHLQPNSDVVIAVAALPKSEKPSLPSPGQRDLPQLLMPPAHHLLHGTSSLSTV